MHGAAEDSARLAIRGPIGEPLDGLRPALGPVTRLQRAIGRQEGNPVDCIELPKGGHQLPVLLQGMEASRTITGTDRPGRCGERHGVAVPYGGEQSRHVGDERTIKALVEVEKGGLAAEQMDVPHPNIAMADASRSVRAAQPVANSRLKLGDVAADGQERLPSASRGRNGV